MVHLVKKNINGIEYLYIQKSYHIKGTKNKKRTKHIAYLGKATNFNKKQLNKIIDKYNLIDKGEIYEAI